MFIPLKKTKKLSAKMKPKLIRLRDQYEIPDIFLNLLWCEKIMEPME